MFALCDYTCTYCGRAIEHSFVTIGEKHFHAVENEFGERDGHSCYDQSEHGTKTLGGSLIPGGAGMFEASQPAI